MEAAMSCVSVLRILIFIFLAIAKKGIALQQTNNVEIVTLQVGKEMEHESLSLHMGQRIYRLNDLIHSQWYEIKISYPASVPASFSIQLIKDSSHLCLSRKLLNTEKLIFKASFNKLDSSPPEVHILVAVEPAGVVAQPGVREREYIIYNIVCDELAFGIPYKAWHVGMVAVLCLAVALVIPYFLPQHIVPLDGAQSSDSSSKTS